MTTAYDMGNVPPIEVKHRLLIAREYAGLEQAELAEMIGVSRNTIGNMEKGRGKPRQITLNAWALATGVPVKWIENGDVPSPSDDGGTNQPEPTSDKWNWSIKPGGEMDPAAKVRHLRRRAS